MNVYLGHGGLYVRPCQLRFSAMLASASAVSSALGCDGLCVRVGRLLFEPMGALDWAAQLGPLVGGMGGMGVGITLRGR